MAAELVQGTGTRDKFDGGRSGFDGTTGPVLCIDVKEGKGFKSMDLASRNDCYVVIQCGDKWDRTPVKEDDDTPSWYHHCRFDLSGIPPESITVFLDIYDRDEIGKDDFVGRAQVSVRELKDGKHHEMWLNLMDKNQKTTKGNLLVRGHLYDVDAVAKKKKEFEDKQKRARGEPIDGDGPKGGLFGGLLCCGSRAGKK